MSGIYSTDKSKTIASLADVDLDNPVNDEVLTYKDGLFVNLLIWDSVGILNSERECLDIRFHEIRSFR